MVIILTEQNLLNKDNETLIPLKAHDFNLPLKIFYQSSFIAYKNQLGLYYILKDRINGKHDTFMTIDEVKNYI